MLANDSDADTGETVLLRVTKVELRRTLQVAVAQTGFATVAGTYGNLLIKWTGNYGTTWTSLASTIGLAAGVQATEHFAYRRQQWRRCWNETSRSRSSQGANCAARRLARVQYR